MPVAAMDAPIVTNTPRLRRQSSLVNSASLKPSLSTEITYSPSKGKSSTLLKQSLPSTRWLPFMSSLDWRVISTITALSFVVRLFALNHPSVVIFDEVHFGGFATKYLKGDYFLDVHPPLARLLVTLSAWIGGSKGSFNFYDIGADYLRDNVPYVTMRSFTATLGALIVPVAFITLRCIGVSSIISGTVSTMLLFDNALTAQSRLILLDSYLVFFTSTTAMFWMLFSQEKHTPFKLKWWTWLALCGASLGLVASCKWVGLFVVAVLGLYTITDLWNTFGDTSVPLTDFGRHFSARALCLIGIPFSIYASTFYIHFALQQNWNIGASGMSVAYQQTLKGGDLPPAFQDVYFGSQIALRQYKSEGGYLHSHSHLYPEGSKQQQVTTYHHRDENNHFIIRRPFVVNVTYKNENAKDELETLAPLKHGDVVRLEHVLTGRFLHSHPVQAPLADKDHNWEVSGYGMHSGKFSDLNDNWRVESVDRNGEPIGKLGDLLHAVTGKIRLVHANLGCLLNCANRPLPEWGFKQGEVTCGRETLKKNSIWFIETNSHPLMTDDAPKVSYPKAGFWNKFVELNVKMWITNKALSADHPFASRPTSWPILSRGLGFWNGNHVPKTEEEHKRQKEIESRQGVDPNYKPSQKTEEERTEEKRLRDYYKRFRSSQIYLLGNPVVWLTSTVSLVVFISLSLVNRGFEKRGMSLPYLAIYKGHSSAGFLFMAWLMHWAPFFAMQRQLFLHHYLPALYFAVLLLAVQMNHGFYFLTGKFPKLYKSQIAICGVLVAATIGLFVIYSPITYGLKMTKSYCKQIKLIKQWDFDCDSLLDNLKNQN